MPAKSFAIPTKTVTVTDDEKLGNIMRGMRKAAGLSLRAMAGALGFSAPYLCDLEFGRRAWTDEKVKSYIAAVKAVKSNA